MYGVTGEYYPGESGMSTDNFVREIKFGALIDSFLEKRSIAWLATGIHQFDLASKGSR